MEYQSSKIIEIFNRLLGQSWIRKGMTQAIYKCPFCSHHKKKLEIAVGGPDLGSYHCWICGVSGKTFNTLLWKLRADKNVYAELAKYAGNKVYKNFESNDIVLSLPNEFISLSKPGIKTFEYVNAISYLRDRNITKEDIIRYNIGYCEQGDYKNRVVIPSYNKDGKLNFFCARAYNDLSNVISYMLPPWDKDIVGFELLINWKAPVIIVEGAFDAIAIRRNVIPLFGNTISNKLLLTIVENEASEVNIILDNDAFSKSVSIYNILNRYSIKTKLIKLDEKDPSVLGFNRINTIISDAVFTDYEDLIRMKMNN